MIQVGSAEPLAPRPASHVLWCGDLDACQDPGWLPQPLRGTQLLLVVGLTVILQLSDMVLTFVGAVYGACTSRDGLGPFSAATAPVGTASHSRASRGVLAAVPMLYGVRL